MTNGEYYQNALDSLQLATSLLQENMPAGLKLYIYTNYAKALYDTGDSRSAINYYQKAISYKKQTSNEYNKANLDYLYGYMLFQATDSLQEAYDYLTEALAFYRKNPSIMLTKSLLAMAEVEAKRNHAQNSYQLALEAYKTEQKSSTRVFTIVWLASRPNWKPRKRTWKSSVLTLSKRKTRLRTRHVHTLVPAYLY